MPQFHGQGRGLGYLTLINQIIKFTCQRIFGEPNPWNRLSELWKKNFLFLYTHVLKLLVDKSDISTGNEQIMSDKLRKEKLNVIVTRNLFSLYQSVFITIFFIFYYDYN